MSAVLEDIYLHLFIVDSDQFVIQGLDVRRASTITIQFLSQSHQFLRVLIVLSVLKHDNFIPALITDCTWSCILCILPTGASAAAPSFHSTHQKLVDVHTFLAMFNC